LRWKLEPVRGMPFLVFHDAYQYLEHRYGMTAVGAVAIDPERPPGARHLAELRRRIAGTGARCVFAEPQFKPDLVEPLREGTPVRAGVLDPLGADLPPGPGHYEALMRALGESLRTCLAG
jgi:zinc transport system substrate-binding protein